MTALHRYLDSNRSYHTFAHIGHMIENLSINFSNYQSSRVLKYAIAYHDCEYFVDKPKGYSERRSALAAQEELKDKFSDTDSDEIMRLILLTIDHKTTENDEIGKIIIDLDLAGLSTDMYWQNSLWVREEYKIYREDQWLMGRKLFLETFLARDFIYQTDLGKNRWEYNARKNMKLELKKVKELLGQDNKND